MKAIYDHIAHQLSKDMTKKYSTSFSLGIKLFDKPIQKAIYGVYAYVRLMDEIVDTFEGYPQAEMLEKAIEDTYFALKNGISTNPIIHHFQEIHRQYDFDPAWLKSFIDSMKADLHQKSHDEASYKTYIVGSAEVVGLMCLKIFVNGDQKRFDELKFSAEKLGSAFQKINFLRDLQADYRQLNRTYFPGIDFDNFSQQDRNQIEDDIEQEFAEAKRGIDLLPKSSRYGVLLAYIYYKSLHASIKKSSVNQLLSERIRVSNVKKAMLAAEVLFLKKISL
jgi:15-cis-phytoene synthase